MNTTTMPQNPLLGGVSDPDAERILQGSTSDLAMATRPAFCHNHHSPVQWTGSDWEDMELNRNDLFDMAAVREQFDRDRFLIDGYLVLRGIVLPQGTDVVGVRTMRHHSVFAEYFPASHIPFMMNVLTHPHAADVPGVRRRFFRSQPATVTAGWLPRRWMAQPPGRLPSVVVRHYSCTPVGSDCVRSHRA
jgi:hypothetical protein